ncbi:MAG TPA: glycosyltransferase, partial [Longimicrobiales bacterium]|nr:glycosyltransferase [Longimicrobiales bacterium]
MLGEGAAVTLVTPERWGGAPWEAASFDGELDIRRLPVTLHGHNHLHLYRGLGPVLESGGYDLIHVDEEPFSLVTGQVGRWARRKGSPWVFFAWQNLAKRLPPPFGLLQRRVFREAAGAIAGSEGAARVLRSAGFAGPVLVSPQMGVAPERFRQDPTAREARRRELGIGPSTFLVGYVGRLVPEKGVALAVQALQALPRVHLALVGGGPDAEGLARLAGRLGVSDRLHLVGAVPSLEVPEWMAALDVLVLPSRTTSGWAEQFGRVLVEAMACEVPVVASDSGAIPEVVGRVGRIVPEGSVQGLAEALRDLAEDGVGRRLLGREGRVRVLAWFTHQRVVDAQVSFYRRLLGLERPGG